LWFAVFEVDRGGFLSVFGVAAFVSMVSPCASAGFDSTTFCGADERKIAFQNARMFHLREL